MKRKQLAALGLAVVMAAGTVGTSGITVMASETQESGTEKQEEVQKSEVESQAEQNQDTQQPEAEQDQAVQQPETEQGQAVQQPEAGQDQTAQQPETEQGEVVQQPETGEEQQTQQPGSEQNVDGEKETITEDEFIAMIQAEVDALLAEADANILGPLMYTEASWQTYETAKAEMLALRADPVKYYDPQGTQINAIFERFINAVNSLELRPDVVDKSELYELIAMADQIVSQTEVYDPDYIQALKEVLATIDRDKIEQMTQSETDQAVAALKQLLQKPIVSENGVVKLIEEGYQSLEQLKASGLYADQDLAEIQTVLDEAKKAADNADWDLAVEKLNTANQKMTEISMSAEKIKEALANKVADKEYKDLYEDIQAHPENYDKNTTRFYEEFHGRYGKNS